MKDYYSILGVSQQATQDEIKHAYRLKARQCHPDMAGEDSCRDFQEVQEAYRILGNSSRRRSYDVHLQIDCAPGHSIFDCAVEPLTDSLDTLLSDGFASFRRHAWDIPARRPPSRQFVDVELHLSVKEALLGVTAILAVPVTRRCPQCHGQGLLLNGYYLCSACYGRKNIQEQYKLEVPVPAGVQHQTILALPFDDVVPDHTIRLHILIRQSLLDV